MRQVESQLYTSQVAGREGTQWCTAHHADATKLAELIRTREVSPVEVMKAHLDRIEAVNLKEARYDRRR